VSCTNLSFALCSYLQLLREISETNSFFFAGGGYDLTNCLQRNDAFLHQAKAASSNAPAAGGSAASKEGSGTSRSRSNSVSRRGGRGAEQHHHEDDAHSTHHHPLVMDARPAPPVGAVITRDGATSSDGAAAVVDPTHSDDRFFWNRKALSSVLAAGHPARGFITPIINGFVESSTCKVGDSDVTLLLISRRASARQGTRFNMRGADAEGNVANYAETEQIATLSDGRVSSYVQIRGSIPILWDQPVSMKYTPRVFLKGNDSANSTIFARHMRQQIHNYGYITAVNLIDKKKDQKMLGEAYEKHAVGFLSANANATLSNSSDKNPKATPLHYVWFDFHAECKKMRWDNLSKLVDIVSKDFALYGYYAKDARGTVTATQAGVFRTNCMDNLDRTNVVQSLFARRAALLAIPSAWDKTQSSGCSVLTSPFRDFENCFNNLWADNADAISMLYSGTGALKTDFTRTGKRTLAGAVADGVNSIKRYVLNNLNDGRTQDAWDLFIGKYVPLRQHSQALMRQASSHDVAVTGVGASAAKTPAARKGHNVKHTSPLKAHLAALTPFGFLTGSVLLFFGLATTVAVSSSLVMRTLPPPSLAQRLAYGFGAAAFVMGGLAYALISKGVGFGKNMVSKPQFVRHASNYVTSTGSLPSAALHSAASSFGGFGGGSSSGASAAPAGSGSSSSSSGGVEMTGIDRAKTA
jgi:SacI homology domain